MNKKEIKNKISEHKECCKKLAEEYRQRYNEDKTDKLALNMFYHNVIAYNDFENVLAMIEDRNSMMLCFAEPPILTEKTVEVDINRIAELEQKISVLLSCKNCPENKGGYICEKEYEDKCLAQKIQYIKELKEENAELKKQVEQKQHLADVRLEQSLETYKLFSDERKARIDVDIALDDTTDQLTYAKTIIQDLLDNTDESARQRAEDFLKENK